MFWQIRYLWLLLLCVPLDSVSGAIPKYNVLLISIDTLSASHLAFYGYQRNTAPNLAALAKDSIVFQRAYSHSNNTLPSHLSMLSGTYPEMHKVMHVHESYMLPLKIPTLAEILNKQNYRTAFIADRRNAYLSPFFGMARGFTDFQYSGIDIERTTKGIIDWLSDHFSENFFIFFHTNLVHDPYIPSEKNLEMFNPNSDLHEISREAWIEQRTRLEKNSQKDAFEKMRKDFWKKFDLSKEADKARLIALYDACIRDVDHHIGRIMDALKFYQLYDNTIIIITSDHGEAFGGHGKFRHLTLYNDTLHVPLLIRVPGYKPENVSSLVQGIDISPTVLQLLGLARAPTMEGKSLVPLFTEPKRSLHDFIFSQYDGMHSIQSLDWKLFINQRGISELYNLATDPEEKQNIADKNPEVLRGLSMRLNEFITVHTTIPR